MKTREQALDIARRAKRELEKLYGERLRAVYLFGSCARGDADEDSDVDVAVVLDRASDPLSEIRASIGVFSDLGLEENVLVAPLIVSESDLRQGRAAIHRTIVSEGIAAA